jgi:predicted RNA-binding Zn-ribbon protein involved in translation (DUF1610 family)
MKVTCPKCGSDQINANKKGFSGGKAVAGAVLTGGIGLLAGTIGSSKVVCTCLACGNQFKAGQGKVVYEPGDKAPAPGPVIDYAKRRKANSTVLIVLGILVLIIIVAAAFG